MTLLQCREPAFRAGKPASYKTFRLPRGACSDPASPRLAAGSALPDAYPAGQPEPFIAVTLTWQEF
ncbi:hypothetical protein PUN4_600131 [Paraburkholderia unamae]|nr:hypothetical protein PUN4_600131 [Paraburkholderia unamae]